MNNNISFLVLKKNNNVLSNKQSFAMETITTATKHAHTFNERTAHDSSRRRMNTNRVRTFIMQIDQVYHLYYSVSLLYILFDMHIYILMPYIQYTYTHTTFLSFSCAG